MVMLMVKWMVRNQERGVGWPPFYRTWLRQHLVRAVIQWAGMRSRIQEEVL